MSVANDIVRHNLMTQPGYSPYCGDGNCKLGMPRTTFDGHQFACACGWRSQFPADFIERYKIVRKMNAATSDSVKGRKKRGKG